MATTTGAEETKEAAGTEESAGVEPVKTRWEQWWQRGRIRLIGPAGSVLFHGLLVILLVNFAVTATVEQAPTVEVVVMTPSDPVKLEELLAPVEPPKDPLTAEPVDVLNTPETYSDVVSAMPGVGSGTDSGLGNSESSDGGIGSGDANAPMGFEIGSAKSPLVLRGVYANRTRGGRGDALRAFNLSGVNTEEAVTKALVWLKKHQNNDGSWGPQYPAAMTGLAILAFLAHGESTSSPEYGDAVRRGLRWLLSHQENGRFVGGGPGASVQITCYEHAIATYAVSEAYGLTTIPLLKSAMESAVQIIVDGQNESGSWDYGYERGPKANTDVSLAGWHLQALKAAQAAGAENKGIEAAIEDGMRGLQVMVDKDRAGAFHYSTRAKTEGATMPMTGVAVLCMQLLHHGGDANAKAGLNILKDILFRWTRGEQNQDQRLMGEWPLYGWYYITQVRFQGGGAQWNTWNKQLAPVVVRMQNPDGSWCPPPNCTEGGYGPVYCTALGTLILEVYYRFLPTYQKVEPEESAKPKSGQEEDDEIVIKYG